jgi:polygalacturonase
MSIGSPTDGGASAIRVADLSIDGADNGLRIKSNITRGGLVDDVVFEDVCIRDTANPILMDTNYSAHVSKEYSKPPVFRNIVVRNVRVEGGGKVTLEGLDAAHRLGIRFDGVLFDDPANIQVSAKHAEVDTGPGAFNLKVTGTDVTVTGSAGKSVKNACTGKFVDFAFR